MSFIKELKRRNVFRVGIAYTVATWLLIQVTDTVFPRIGLPDSAVTLVIALLAIGFIPALILAWAFEMTPEGIKREKDIDREKSITPTTGRKLDRAIIGILTIALAYFVFDKFNTQGLAPQTAETTVLAAPSEPVEQEATTVQSVAVLPFTAMSSGEDDSYFADGLTEEILNSLARLPELLVTARTSSFHFKDKNLPVPEIAATLGVDHIVEGSVRRSGERVRITAQLIRADDGFHLWSNTYDRTLEDVFAVQEDIAENIAETLDVVLNEAKRKQMSDVRIKDVEAFIAYQKGLEAFEVSHSTGDPGADLEIANAWFDRAIEIVPGLTNALYLRTDLYGHIIYSNAIGRDTFSESTPQEAVQEIKLSLDRAWQSASSDSQRAIMDAERNMLSNNWTGLPEKLDKALKPGDCTPLNWLPDVAVPFGWAAAAADHESEVLRCDPLRAVPAIMLAYWEIWNGNAAKAVETAEKYLQIQGFHPWLDDARYMALIASGQYRNDPDMLSPQPAGSAYQVPRELFLHAINNDIETAQNVLDDWLVDNEADQLSMIMAMAVFGNREAANDYTSRVDSRIGGTLALTETVKTCMCGAPFDLESTPNYRQRIEEAGFDWPPPSPIKYPAKDW
jgi:adenylate cyclase